MTIKKIEPVIYQFRYFGESNDNNFPNNSTWIGLDLDNLKTKNLLSDYGSAIKIGIQTLPGIKFYIGDANFSNSIIVDHTGIYELDLRNTTTSVSALYFDATSIARIDTVDNANIIVDVLCNPKNGTVIV